MTRRKERDGGGHSHARIFAGQTGDLSAQIADHRKAKAFRKANCVCVHLERADNVRIDIESDLRARKTGTAV